MKQFIDNLISRLTESAIKTLGVSKSEFAMDKGEYSSYCSLSLYEVKEAVNQLAEEYKPRTNADKVRQMSDEELAKFCSRACPIDKKCIYWNVETDCEKCALIWLKSEVKDGE